MDQSHVIRDLALKFGHRMRKYLPRGKLENVIRVWSGGNKREDEEQQSEGDPNKDRDRQQSKNEESEFEEDQQARKPGPCAMIKPAVYVQDERQDDGTIKRRPVFKNLYVPSPATNNPFAPVHRRPYHKLSNPMKLHSEDQIGLSSLQVSTILAPTSAIEQIRGWLDLFEVPRDIKALVNGHYFYSQEDFGSHNALSEFANLSTEELKQYSPFPMDLDTNELGSGNNPQARSSCDEHNSEMLTFMTGPATPSSLKLTKLACLQDKYRRFEASSLTPGASAATVETLNGAPETIVGIRAEIWQADSLLFEQDLNLGKNVSSGFAMTLAIRVPRSGWPKLNVQVTPRDSVTFDLTKSGPKITQRDGILSSLTELQIRNFIYRSMIRLPSQEKGKALWRAFSKSPRRDKVYQRLAQGL